MFRKKALSLPLAINSFIGDVASYTDAWIETNSREAYMSFASSVLRAILSHDVILLHVHEVVDSNDNHLKLNK